MSEEIEPNETPEDDAAGTPALAGSGQADSASPGRELAPMFTAGGQPGPGRPKGSSSATTMAMRTAVAAVFEDLQTKHGGKGRYPHFYEWAAANPTEFYRMAARQLPVRIESGEGAIGVLVFRGIND